MKKTQIINNRKTVWKTIDGRLKAVKLVTDGSQPKAQLFYFVELFYALSTLKLLLSMKYIYSEYFFIPPQNLHVHVNVRI